VGVADAGEEEVAVGGLRGMVGTSPVEVRQRTLWVGAADLAPAADLGGAMGSGPGNGGGGPGRARRWEATDLTAERWEAVLRKKKGCQGVRRIS
jgi:hypothetical protein